MTGFPRSFVFLCGAHIDQSIRLEAEAIAGASNPAVISTIPGGAALNSASIAAALGLRSAIVSPIGRDAHGTLLKQVCRERKLNEFLVTDPHKDTGVYCALFQPDGNLIIGAAALSIYDVMDQNWLRKELVPHSNEANGLFLTSNLKPDCMAEACEGFDTITAATISPAKAKRLEPVLDRLDLLFTNRAEAGILCESDCSGSELANRLMQKGVRSGIITDGDNPVWYFKDNQVSSISQERITNIVDVNGAGDALAGGVLAALASGSTFDEAVKIGMQIAGVTLRFNGPYPDLTDTEFNQIKDRIHIDHARP